MYKNCRGLNMIEIQNTRINEQFLETNSTIDNFVNKDREKKKVYDHSASKMRHVIPTCSVIPTCIFPLKYHGPNCNLSKEQELAVQYT